MNIFEQIIQKELFEYFQPDYLAFKKNLYNQGIVEDVFQEIVKYLPTAYEICNKHDDEYDDLYNPVPFWKVLKGYYLYKQFNYEEYIFLISNFTFFPHNILKNILPGLKQINEEFSVPTNTDCFNLKRFELLAYKNLIIYYKWNDIGFNCQEMSGFRSEETKDMINKTLVCDVSNVDYKQLIIDNCSLASALDVVKICKHFNPKGAEESAMLVMKELMKKV